MIACTMQILIVPLNFGSQSYSNTQFSKDNGHVKLANAFAIGPVDVITISNSSNSNSTTTTSKTTTTTTSTTTTTTTTSQTTSATTTTTASTVTEVITEPAIEPVATATWDGPVLTASAGVVYGPSGKETYYNLDMSGVISNMNNLGYYYSYWVRDDGVKMFGGYVMCAAALDIHPRGSLVETSLGTGIVCDTGGFAYSINITLRPWPLLGQGIFLFNEKIILDRLTIICYNIQHMQTFA